MKKYKKKVRVLIIPLITWFFWLPFLSWAQFVEEPVNSTPVVNHNQVNRIFDLLIIFSALVFIVSVIGFIIGFIRLVISEGDEKDIKEANNILVLSGWIFASSIAVYLLVNIIKFFIY